MKIVTVVGARPQFIKAAVVSRVIGEYIERGENLREVIVHTGQHYDANMSDVFFQEMHIPRPQYNLGLGGGLHGAMTGRMLEGIENILLQEKPDIVLVYGDTNSTLAGALASAKLHIPVAHVEAGLRSFNMRMPEEINRILTDRVSQFLFCPTMTAVKNLSEEGISSGGRLGQQVCNVGDVMYDAVLHYKKTARPTPNTEDMLSKYPDFYLATLHRAENTDNPVRLAGIISALDHISEKIPVILPLHPRTRKLLSEAGLSLQTGVVTEPVSYFDMLHLLNNCRGVFTDSGGLQKEAFFFQKYCITLREETEWVELVENGFNVLAGAEPAKIIEAESSLPYRAADFSLQLYGAGNAGNKIVTTIAQRQK